MKNAVKTVFGSIAGAALALTPMQAFAEDVANTNTPVSTATVTPAAVQAVQFVDVQNRSMNDARTAMADVSHDKVAIVVWGGNRTIQQEAYNAARDLVGAGIPTAFVLGPDHNQLDGEAIFQVYAAGEPTGNDGYYGRDNSHLIREDMRSAAIAAYREAFPQRVAALSLR